jgi:biotin carboxyl carrier protein
MPIESVEAPLPGKILNVTAKAGDAIEESGEICTIEAMKMETPILAPVAGTVKQVSVSAGQTIQAGDVIAEIEY